MEGNGALQSGFQVGPTINPCTKVCIFNFMKQEKKTISFFK